MASISATTGRSSVVAHRRLERLSAVLLAVVATLAVWAIATVGFGLDLRAPAFGTASENPEIGAGTVAFTTAVAGLAAWAVLALAERLLGTRARPTWTAIALIALLVSFGGPLSGTGVTDENRLVLALMHVVAAALLIPLLYRSAAAGRPGAGRDACVLFK